MAVKEAPPKVPAQQENALSMDPCKRPASAEYRQEQPATARSVSRVEVLKCVPRTGKEFQQWILPAYDPTVWSDAKSKGPEPVNYERFLQTPAGVHLKSEIAHVALDEVIALLRAKPNVKAGTFDLPKRIATGRAFHAREEPRKTEGELTRPRYQANKFIVYPQKVLSHSVDLKGTFEVSGQGKDRALSIYVTIIPESVGGAKFTPSEIPFNMQNIPYPDNELRT